jgi:hypothetical protein
MYKQAIHDGVQLLLAAETVFLFHIHRYDAVIFCFCLFLISLVHPVLEKLTVIARPEQEKIDHDVLCRKIAVENATFLREKEKRRQDTMVFGRPTPNQRRNCE